MPQYLAENQIVGDNNGIFFIPSGSILTPTASGTTSIAQITAFTASVAANGLIPTASLNAYFIIPLLSGSDQATGEDLIEVIRYHTSSINLNQEPTTINPTLYFTSSNGRVRYRNISINSTDDSTNVLNKTYNTITGSIFNLRSYSASLENNKIIITHLKRTALPTPIFYTSSVSPNIIGFNIVRSGFGVLNFTPVPTLSSDSASFSMKYDANDNGSLMFGIETSSVAYSESGRTNNTILYFSGSGKVGLNTNDPQSDFDVLVNEAQFQKPGTRKGLKINQDGNIESFDKDPTTASTGSEFLLRFSRGTAITKASTEAIGLGPFADDTEAQAFFNGLKAPEQNSILEKIERIGFIDPPQVGDTLGSIRWVAESGSISGYDDRSTGETAVIKAVVSDGDASGIQADMIFSVAGKTGAAEQKFLLDATNNHQLTGSLNMGAGTLYVDSIVAHDNAQTKINVGTDDMQFFANNGTSGFRIQNNAITINGAGTNYIDFFVEGDTDPNLIATDASTDKVGIGTSTPSEKLTVEGNISASGYVYGRQLEQNDMSVSTITPTDSYIYFPLGGQTRDENATVTNQNIQKLAVVPGKPRKAIIRAVTPGDGLGNTSFTCSYHAANPGTSSVSLIAAKYSISTGTNHEAVTFDFTNGVDEGSWDDVPAGARVYMSIKVPNTAFLSEIDVLGATSLWEWDYGA